MEDSPAILRMQRLNKVLKVASALSFKAPFAFFHDGLPERFRQSIGMIHCIMPRPHAGILKLMQANRADSVAVLKCFRDHDRKILAG